MRAFVFLFALGFVGVVASAGCGGVFGGACTTDSECNGGRCLFAIGSCDAVGQCMAKETGPMCNSEEELCGCHGEMVVTGCGFPQGFASGPTTGKSGSVSCSP